MDVPVRLGWLPGEAVVLPAQFPVATGGRSNELIIGPLQQGTSLSVYCNARTAEVSAAEKGGGPATYECTLRGTAATASDYKDIYVLEYSPKGGIRTGSIITFKLLSLLDKSSISIDRVELLQSTQNVNELPDIANEDSHQLSAAVASTTSSSSSSQMDGIRELLAQLATQPSTEDSDFVTIHDPKRALMTAIAKSALNKRKDDQNINYSGGGSSLGITSSGVMQNRESEGVNAALSLLPQLVTLLQKQQNEIRDLKESVNKIEALCRETQETLAAAGFSTKRKEKAPVLD